MAGRENDPNCAVKAFRTKALFTSAVVFPHAAEVLKPALPTVNAQPCTSGEAGILRGKNTTAFAISSGRSRRPMMIVDASLNAGKPLMPTMDTPVKIDPREQLNPPPAAQRAEA
jgi:hypothetical protein